jgi:hypothetical protein
MAKLKSLLIKENNVGKYAAELRSRTTKYFDTPAEALDDAISNWGYSWGNTNPDWTQKPMLMKVVDVGHGRTGLKYLTGFSVRVHRRSQYDAVSIVDITDNEGKVIATNPDPRTLEDVFDKYFKQSSISENNFEPAPSAGAGSVGGGYGTYGGGNTVQDPDHFASSTFHKGNEDSSSLAQMPERPDRKSSSGGVISPGAAADKVNSEKPMNPADGFDKQVNTLFQKKETPSPDDLMSALQYELNRMVKKDKTIAKQTVINNLKKDPKYYTNLDMLNIDDDKMKVDESDNSTFTKTKNVLDEMIAQRKSQKAVPANTDEVNQIFKDLWDRRQHRNKPKE